MKYNILSADPLDGHILNDKHCKYCSEGFPQRCQCGGMLHASIHITGSNGRIQISKCNKCGKIR